MEKAEPAQTWDQPRQPSNKRIGLTEWLLLIPTWALAIAALWSLHLSYQSAEQVAQSSQEVTEALATFKREVLIAAWPIVQVTGYDWASHTGQPTLIDCRTPPYGVIIEFTNKSFVPIEVHETEGELSFRDEIAPISNKGHLILPTGEKSNIVKIAPNLLRKSYKRTPGVSLAPPFLEFNLRIQYSKMGQTEKFLYRTRQVILYDCATQDRHRRRMEESIDIVSDAV